VDQGHTKKHRFVNQTSTLQLEKACGGSVRWHSDHKDWHRPNFSSKRYLYPGMKLPVSLYKSYCSSFCHISYGNLNTQMEEAMSKGRIYSHQGISATFSLSFLPDDFSSQGHTYLGNDWFSDKVSCVTVVRKRPLRLANRRPNPHHRFLSASSYRLSCLHI